MERQGLIVLPFFILSAREQHMIPKVFIQCSNGIPVTRNCYDAYNGFKLRGHEIVKVEWGLQAREVDTTELKDITNQDIFVGGIPVFRKVLNKLGIQVPDPIDYPEIFLADQNQYFGREIKRTTLGAIREHFGSNKNVKPTFIKPVAQKQFTGYVVNIFFDLLKVLHLEDTTELWTSGNLPFESEYRVYVNRKHEHEDKEIIGIGHYNGDPLIFPDSKTIKKCVKTFNDSGQAPRAYGLDFGVSCESKKTYIIEANIFGCLGNYNLPASLYAEAVEEAWFEIVGKNDKEKIS